MLSCLWLQFVGLLDVVKQMSWLGLLSLCIWIVFFFCFVLMLFFEWPTSPINAPRRVSCRFSPPYRVLLLWLIRTFSVAMGTQSVAVPPCWNTVSLYGGVHGFPSAPLTLPVHPHSFVGRCSSPIPGPGVPFLFSFLFSFFLSFFFFKKKYVWGLPPFKLASKESFYDIKPGELVYN